MRAVRIGLAIFVCLTISVFTQYAFADDGYWGTDETPIDITGIGSGSELDLAEHYDADPWKGWGILTVRNWCYDDWGDFHLRIKEVCSGWNNTDVIFDDVQAPQLWVKEYGMGSYVQYTGLDWNIGPDGTTMDLFFYDNPIEQYDKAIIKVYTDNTSWHSPWFKIAVHATPIPEPATVALLGLGAVALFRRTKKR